MTLLTASIGSVIIFSSLYWLAWELLKPKYTNLLLDYIIKLTEGPIVIKVGKDGELEKLANYIMAEVDGEPSQNEGAGECAIRIIKQLKKEIYDLKNPRCHCERCTGIPDPYADETDDDQD